MSDQWGTTEPNASGVPTTPPGGGGGWGGNINVSVPGLDKLNDSFGTLISQLNDLKSTMASFSQNQHQMGQGVVNTFNQVQSSASNASDAVKTFFTSLTGSRPGGSAFGTALNFGLESGLGQDIAMFPLRYLQNTIGQNRNFSLAAGGALAGQQFATGIPTTQAFNPYGQNRPGLFEALGNTFGAGRIGLPTGSAEEITQFLNIARQAGAMVPLERMSTTQGWGTGGNPRAPGFSFGAYQMQQMYPGMPLGQIGQTLGSYVANSGAQRQSVMLTGGAFSMIKGGGQMKSIDEWAESILRWLENQRPGGKRGQGFTYDELLSQQYPGSNISAWFDANDVPADMQEVWWNYALAKSHTRATTTGASLDIRAAAGAAQGTTPNPALSRLMSTQPLTQTSFNLAGSLGGYYAQRESANQGFNRLIGQMQQTAIPAALAGPLGFMRGIPDSVEELLMSVLERTGILGAGIGGALGYGGLALGGGASLFENLLGENGLLFSGLPGGMTSDLTAMLSKLLDEFGDVGDVDVGDWGAMGATSPNSLHPSMNAKVSAMMKANPRLRMNSGRRDEALQRKLRGQGHSRVSGKSSAHTRGLAADMGPASEYGWIMANARKFGLQSGANHGEPWHVGLPGIGDDGTLGGLGALLGLLGGSGADAASTISGSLPGLFSLLFGQFGSEGVVGKSTAADIQKTLAYDPNYTKKIFAASSYKTGGVYGTGQTIFDKILAAAQAEAGVTYGTRTNTNHATEGGANAQTLADAVRSIGLSPDGLSAGALTALLAQHVGFNGADLVTAMAIAGRESKYNPMAHNPDASTGDDSYGLFQINMLGSLGPARRAAYGLASNEDLYNPITNLTVAHKMAYENDTPFYAWGPYRGDDPRHGTDVNAATGYIREAGITLGDIDGDFATTASGTRRSTIMNHYHNTFVIQGGGGNSGIDTRRVVTQIADQLESEMNRRQVRTN